MVSNAIRRWLRYVPKEVKMRVAYKITRCDIRDARYAEEEYATRERGTLKMQRAIREREKRWRNI